MIFQDRISRYPIAFDTQRGQEALRHADGLADQAALLLQGAAGCSPYLAGLIAREAEWFMSRLKATVPNATDLVADETAGFDALAPQDLGKALRQAKGRIALLTALADLGGVWSLSQVTAALTQFADRATDLALRAHVRVEAARGRLPETVADAGGIVALAMGKMGAGELNYSSDIDLIILYDDSVYAAADQHEARAALIRATRNAVVTLSERTAEGYVFRTDLRLRPDAAVTPVCIGFSSALAYYEAEGRTWERAAYIKARPCAGNLAAGQKFLTELRPFIWRRHLDFATIHDTQEMRLRIRQHKGLQNGIAVAGHNMKLGQGGIREIEFFTQTKQLISGGRDPDLRVRETVAGLTRLAEKGWVPHDVAQELIGHYQEHREIEHRLQMVNDAQTHSIPVTSEGIDQIAHFMGQQDSSVWASQLLQRLKRVAALTDDFFTPPDTAPAPEIPDEAKAIIALWPSYPALKSQRARQIFSRIKTDLLNRMARAPDPLQALTHFDRFLKGLPAGVQIFSLFEANSVLIDLIVDICGTAPGLAAHLSRHPEVLDAVLGGSFFEPWPSVTQLTKELSEKLSASVTAPDGDYERGLDLVRRWTHDHQFRTGVHHLRGLIQAAEAGVQYADIADAALTALFPVVAKEFSRRHGALPGRGAVLVAMGSLAVRLLNSASDLDLIMIYDSDGQEMSDGVRPLAARAYYARLMQAMINATTALTAAGRVFEIDMRLRPSGRKGPVATSLQSFRDYQLNESWTWEHLALTRARVVVGCGQSGGDLVADFEDLRLEILTKRGRTDSLIQDLGDMRQRIFTAKATETEWDAKIGRGRLQDIELFAQACALQSAAPARVVHAQLRAGQRAGLVSSADGMQLAATYRLLWDLQCTGRLLTDGAIDLEKIGQAGQELLLRETGADDFIQLAQQLAQKVQTAGTIIESYLGTAAKPQAEKDAAP